MRWLFYLLLMLLPTLAAAQADRGIAAQEPVNPLKNVAILRIGVASNFNPTLKALVHIYTKENGIPIAISSASSGTLYNHARYGAPYDLLLSADRDRPERLVKEGLALPESQMVYAIGRLVLAYQPAMQSVADKGLEALLSTPGLTLAIAHPRVAPYGIAAEAVLSRYPAIERRQLSAINVGQAMHMYVSGGADLALVAKAQQPARALDVPQEWYPPIEQHAVQLRGSEQPELAAAFLQWLGGEKARSIIADQGYRLPDDA